MPRKKNWRRSEARRSLLHRSSNKPAELTPELTPDVMQASESVMTKGLFEASPVSVQAAASPVSVQAPSPVSVQAQPRNQHSNLNLKNKDIQRNLQNKDENKDNQTDLQKKDANKKNQTNDCKMNFTERHCQINSQRADHYDTLQSFGTNIFSEILTETKSPCPVEYDNRSQPYHQFSFMTSFELNTSKNKKSCILTPVTHSILSSSCTDCFENLKPFPSQSIVCGSFHQGSDRFSVESRGSQCVPNALCALIHAQFSNTCSSTEIDQILVEGDTRILYKKILASLKADQKYTSRLLTFDEVPENVNVFTRDIHIIKSCIVSGIAVQQFGNTSSPTLHQSMHTAFQSSSCVLVMIGAICSAVYKKDGMYNFFDSHSHAQNGLSSCNGYSVLIRFSCLDDLITYMYALYDSMQIDMTTQYDLLPVALTFTENYELQYKVTDHSESLLENYFEDQIIRCQKKAQDTAVAMSMQKKTCENKLKKSRTEYYAAFKRKQRSKLAFKEKEKITQLASKQSARKNLDVLAKELAKKQSVRQNPAFKEKEKISQLLSKQSARQNPAFKEKEKIGQLLSKQSARKNVNVLAKELAKKQSARQNPAFKEKEKICQLASKQCARKNVDVLAKELDRKRSARQNPAFKEKERVNQLASKQSARQNTAFKAKEKLNQLASKQSARKSVDMLEKECVKKQSARQNPDFREKEKIYQLASKQKKRQSSFVLECERIAQQQRRQNKRKFEKNALELNGQKKRCKIAEEKSQKMGPYAAYDRKRHDSVVECLKQFEKNIAVGPLFVCTCCHQTWFRKSVSLLKNTNIRRCSLNYCTKLKSVNSEEWICHTCLSALKDGKVPKLSVANGMKWPNKPPELDLHQLEERLIALRIPFMQIRELPRGGQYSLKGNVINVPVDIQPTVNSLPRPMDESFTVAIQLKKKLSYKKVDFKENVRPMRVLTALHWLLTNSDMYENSGITVDTSWFQAVTESAEDTVREFLEVPVQNTNPDINVNNAVLDEEKTLPSVPQDRNKGDGYDSDGFSEVDSNELVGSLDTLVDDANIENKFDQVLTFAPGEGRHPLSLYQDTDAEYLCFPTIFCGQRRPNDTERTILVHYSDIVKWELRSIDRRAAQSVPNIFFKHKKLQMKQISDKVNLAVRRCKNKGKKITAAEARDPAYLERLVKLDEGYCIFRQLRNSPAYLEKRKKDIFAMIRQLSLPTWFVSLSAADTRWNDLLKMLAKLNDAIEYSDKDVEALTWQEKTRLVQKDPVTCSRYFDHRVQEFLNTVLKNEIEPIGKVLDFFYRVEFQQRGSPHIHMLIWIENAPKLEKNTEEEIIQFVDNYLTCSTDDEEIGELVEFQSHKHSKSCRKKGKAICRFGFPLPPLPRTLLLHPLDEDVEKYKKQYSELQKTMNEYKNVTDITFDEFLEQVAKMNLENYIKCIRSSLRAPKIFLKRNPNEMRVNLFNKTILLGWKANLDIQMVLEPYGCATYVVGYISKSQRGMSAQLDAAAREARKGNFDIKKQVRHIGNVFSNCVEVSAQEAVYLALQIPLTKATRDIVFINTSIPEERIFLLKSKSVLDELPAESTNIEADNIIQRYAKRPRQLEKFCLADYVSTVDIVYPKGNRLSEKTEDTNEDDIYSSDSSDENDEDDVDEDIESKHLSSDLFYVAKNGTKYKHRRNPRVIRYVRYDVKKDPENYYRERLMLFMPWRNEAKDLLGSYETYKAHYNVLKDNLESKRSQYEHHIEELELARQMAEEDDAYDEIAPNAEHENREAEEEGEREAKNFVYFNPDRVVEHRQYDIGIEIQSVCSVPAVEINGAMLPDEQYLNLVRSLNLRQREFFNHVLYWLKCKEEPLYAFLSGGAGVGKSVLIKALYQSLYRFLNLREGENPDDIRVLLCAYTGKAAYNINGVTIASAFLKKFKQSGDLLSADELNTFRVKYRHLKVIIIDEISMVGTNTLTFLDTRLQQLTGTKASFGGLSIIAVGDLYQLMPVCDKWIFSDPSKGASALAYNLWKDYFRLYELVDIMRQKDDADFAQMLNRLRQNELTEDDQNELKKHSISPHMTNYPEEAPHLFTENRFVDKHNENYLNRLSEDKVIIPCHDTVVSANISVNKCRKLIEALPDDSNKTANLPKLLTVAVGMIYDITVNVNVADGLTNGSTCVVKFIEYKMEGTDRPSIIWVLFQDSQIGQSTREKFSNRGLYSTNIDKAWTPIFDIERTFIYNFKTYQRIQFPLKPAAGKTIHKAQGSTVDEIVVDLSQTRVRKQPHIHYVALSRVRKLENLYILNLNEAAMAVDEQVKIEMQRLKTEALLELCYVPLYKVDPHKIKVAFNNARSLHKHFKDIEFEPNVLSADVIGFAESRLCTRDDNSYFALKNFKLLRMDETGHDSANRPYHGLALYIKDYFEIQRIEKFHSDICEFMFVTMYSNMKRCFQVVYFYKFPKSTQINLRNAIQHHLIPLVDMHTKLVIIGDFNIDANDSASSFVDFMIKQFKCEQHINQSTTDSGSVIDLIFTNCPASSDVIEAYWSDHKLVYCALDA